MHPTCCWQGSGRDELIGLSHPLCFKSTARLGQRTYPLLPFAAEPRWMRPLSSEHPPAHQWEPAGMSDGSGGCLPAVPLPSHHRAEHRQCRPTRFCVPFSHWGGQSGPGLGKHPSEVGICVIVPAHNQAGWEEVGIRKCCFPTKGVECWGCCGEIRVPMCRPPPACGEPPPGTRRGWEQNPTADTLLLLGHFLRNNWEL